MFTTLGFSQSVSGVTLSAINALADNSLSVSGTQVTIPPSLNKIVGVYGIGANITDLQIVTPTLRVPYLPNIRPLERAAAPTLPAQYVDRRFHPISLVSGDFLQALISDDGTTTRETALLWLADAPIQPVSGEVIPLKLTGTTTLTAYAWTSVVLTASQTLPRGRYSVVGMNAQSAGCIVARIVLPGYQWRPGVVGHTGVVSDPLQPFRHGSFGEFCQFDWNILPNVEFLSGSADTAETVILDLIKVG